MYHTLHVRKYDIKGCELILWENQFFAKLYVNGIQELNYWNFFRHYSSRLYFEKTLRLDDYYTIQLKPRVLNFFYPEGFSELLIDGEEPNFEWITLGKVLKVISN